MCKVRYLPWSLSRFLWQFSCVEFVEGESIFFKGALFDAATDAGEEYVYDVVVMELEEHPAEHFLGVEEVLEVAAVMVCAGVASAIGIQLGEGGGVGRGPHIYA